MGPLGIWEIAAIAVVALVVLGPNRLPEVARKLGGLVSKLRTHSESVKSELRDAIDIEDIEHITKMHRDLREAVSLDGIIDPRRSSSLKPAPSRLNPPQHEPDEVVEDEDDSAAVGDAASPELPTRRIPDFDEIAPDTPSDGNSAADAESSSDLN